MQYGEKYRGYVKNWKWVMLIQGIACALLWIIRGFLPDGLAKPADILMAVLLVSCSIQFIAFALNPDWFRNKTTKEGN